MAKDAAILEIEPSKHKIDVPQSLMWIRRNSGKGLLSLVAEMVRLARDVGKLTAQEYITFQLYDDEKYDATQKRSFLGTRGANQIYNRVISPFYCGLSHDKLLSNALLQSYGLPIPASYAVYHQRRADAAAPVFRDPAALAAFLRDGMTYPCFAKPINGWESRGVSDIRAYDRASDSLVMAVGEPVKVDDFATAIAKLDSGALFQELLQPHPALAGLCGDRVSTVRPMVLISDDRLEVFRSVWKVVAGDNIADNFWRPGNMLAAIESTTGRVERLVRGTGIKHEILEAHPDTGQTLLGTALPQWDEVLRIAKELALILPELRILAPDIAITARGPVFVEINAGGAMDLPQLATGKGSLDDQLKGFLDEVGPFKPLFAC